MDAIEFVKKFGVGRATELVSEVSKSKKLKWYTPQIDINLEPHEFGFSFDEIKQIVDAFDLVEYCNGLENAKELLDEIDSERWVYNLYTNTVISSDYSPCDNMCIKYDVLKQAIELVEKCK